jgi:hypothetical protein
MTSAPEMQAVNDQTDSGVLVSVAVKEPRTLGPHRADEPRRTSSWGQGSSSGRVVRTVRTAGGPRSRMTRFTTL